MSSLNPPLSKEDFINSEWKEVIDNSERKLCNIYYDNFRRKTQEIKEADNHRQYAVFEILQRVTVAPIQSDLDSESSIFLARFPDEIIEFINQIVDEVSDPELQSQIAEILWIKNKKHNYRMGQLAVECYLESAKQLEDPQKWSHCVDRIERSLTLALKINYKPEIVVEYIDEVLNRYQGKDPLWLSVKLHELLQEEKTVHFLRKKQILDTHKYADLADKGAIFAESSKEWDKARNYWEIKAEWHRIEKDKAEVYAARILVAETYIKESQDSLTKHPTPYSKASHDLQKAFEAFERLKSQGTEEERTAINSKMDEVHKLLSQYQEQSLHELITVSSQHNISNEIELARTYVKGKNFQDALLSLAILGIPQKVSDIRKIAEKNAWLSQFAPVVNKNEMGKTVARQPIEPDKAEEAILFDMYRIAVDGHRCHAQAFIEPARYQINLEHSIQIRDLFPIVSHSPFVPSGREYLFAKGLYAGLIGDFFTSTHILIPQIENSVRYLLRKQGAIPSEMKTKKGIEDERDLNTTLFPRNYPQINSIFDADTLFDIQGLLIERSGSNLRNRMAHGLINDNEFAQNPIMSYLWWVTLRFCCLPILNQKQAEEFNPLVQFDGIFKDDPLFDEFVEDMAANRCELDTEIAAYEASLDENQTA
ncbi:DUF4209 domain-containing protein [Anabaena cylindrica FACHB-243]|uniref:Uncharacterized protein n=1 Tax=Anabaena cylindrica (strain ATCC 27899 / PCC 7122) TaxID=272123 RepID=K9ZN07_ANACC|nr:MULTISPECIES: DUF4209 domain-containing protein [Anabaena]AFZ60591.1 hypothetical protein Anacy_5265 [Anabaena cylindrica PCC 7122]MBD2418277.1 DUF4209 domain-containing protein [Anabaena cylindrica FACHB-243]MBY5280761.1 DUF4209 domain-containing protein [Anabaena sp. CCAP 1446/1C]MBY5311454.1 DUF4209 domain-containing protein [Anabaena sp. CCAP 1446/1C]MCM2408796.1 DUF4209 domain-containing protein [Anabaena sp. CCAP 1446/1C]